jgi:glycosyltransferase involved in cell wall biosynthesis
VRASAFLQVKCARKQLTSSGFGNPGGSVHQEKRESISVIMPVYNGSGFLSESLPPLLAMARNGTVLEVIVVDDGSSDGSREIAAEMGARVVDSGGRLGPGGARNQAAREARGELLWFVDADVVVHSDAAALISEGFADPAVIAMFGSYDDRPAAGNFLSQYKNLVHHHYHHRSREEAATFWAGCGAVRKQAFLDVGGFDVERYTRPSIEDIELGYRLRRQGGKIRLLPGLRCTHLKVWRLAGLLHTEIFRRAMPWSRLMLEETGMVGDLNVSRGEQARAALAGSLFVAAAAAILGVLSWWLVILVALAALGANLDLFHLFRRRNGLMFGLLGIAFHQVYYLYSGLAFVYTWLEYRLRQLV